MSNDAYADVLKEINKKFGQGTVRTLGETKPITDNLLSTGCLLLDKALGGGVGFGRITEIYGLESSGKSTLCLHLAKECQKLGKKVAYIDVEHAMDPKYAKHLGVDIDNLTFSQPDCGEDALEIARMMVDSGAFGLIVIDSVAALTPRAELDGEMTDSNIGLQARMLSKAMRVLNGSLYSKNCAMVFINQIREKVGVMFGSPETTTGGKALKFYASQRIELRKSEQIKDGSDIVGSKVKVKIAKNKISAPFKECVLQMTFGDGFNNLADAVSLAVDFDIIEKSGSWYAYNGAKIGQGEKSAIAFLENNPTECDVIIKRIKEKLIDVDIDDLPPTDLSEEEVEKAIIDELTGEVK